MIFFYFHIKNKRKGYFFEVRFYLLNQEKTITYFWRKILSLESRGSASRVGRVSRKGKAATCRNFSSGKGRKETKRKIHSDKYSKLPVLQSAEGLKKKENTFRRIHEKYLITCENIQCRLLNLWSWQDFLWIRHFAKDNKTHENTAKRYQNL